MVRYLKYQGYVFFINMSASINIYLIEMKMHLISFNIFLYYNIRFCYTNK